MRAEWGREMLRERLRGFDYIRQTDRRTFAILESLSRLKTKKVVKMKKKGMTPPFSVVNFFLSNLVSEGRFKRDLKIRIIRIIYDLNYDLSLFAHFFMCLVKCCLSVKVLPQFVHVNS